MASESLSRKVSFEGSDKILNNDLPDPKVDNINNYDIVETFVTFQKDNIIKAKFRFELSNHANIMDNIDQKKIKALDIHFI